MDNRDKIINDLALENTQLRLFNLNAKYEIEELRKTIEEMIASAKKEE